MSDRIADNLAVVTAAEPDWFRGVITKWRNARTRGEENEIKKSTTIDCSSINREGDRCLTSIRLPSRSKDFSAFFEQAAVTCRRDTEQPAGPMIIVGFDLPRARI
jgi:hypothetical protein